MAHKNSILVALLVLLLLVLFSGCSQSSTRSSSAHRRWHQVMEQARLEAAQECIAQGRLQYAIRLLEDLIESDSAFTEQAKQVLAELKAARREIAMARSVDADTAVN